MCQHGFVHCPNLEKLPPNSRGNFGDASISEEALVSYVAAVLEASVAARPTRVRGRVTRRPAEDNPNALTAIADRLQSLSRSGQDEVRERVPHTLVRT